MLVILIIWFMHINFFYITTRFVMLQKSVPFYIQIARILRRELISGVYPVNSKMPDENALAARFGVSKDVIRVSMRLLGKEGLVKAIRSKGTFVCERPDDEGSRIVLMSYHGSLHMDAIRRGIEPVIPDGCDFVLKTTTLDEVEDEKKILENLDMPSVRALIAAPIYNGDQDNSKMYAEIVKQGVPLLIIDHSLPNLQADEVAFDEYGATVEFMHAALDDVGDNEVLLFFYQNFHDRISMQRTQAMNDVWLEGGGDSEKKHRFFIQRDLWDYKEKAEQLFEIYMQHDASVPYIITHSSAVAWEFYQKALAHGVADNIKKIYCIGDILRGDGDFNRKLFCYYRLFDEITPRIKEILDSRLNSPEPPSTPMRYALKFKRMDYDEARNYFISKMM